MIYCTTDQGCYVDAERKDADPGKSESDLTFERRDLTLIEAVGNTAAHRQAACITDLTRDRPRAKAL